MPISPTVTLLRKPEVERRVGLKRSRIDELEREGKFPRRIPISNRAVAWSSAEIDEFIEARIAARDAEGLKSTAAPQTTRPTTTAESTSDQRPTAEKRERTRSTRKVASTRGKPGCAGSALRSGLAPRGATRSTTAHQLYTSILFGARESQAEHCAGQGSRASIS
jgi:prophage regulatory protein